MSTDGHRHHHTIPFDPSARSLGVVVGFDGSQNAAAALATAAETASRRGAVLTVLSVYRLPVPVYGTYAALPAEPESDIFEQRAETVLGAAAEQLRGHTGEISYVTAEGDSVGVLVDASAHAELVVVGARGRGGFLGLLRGSVATALPAHAQCPTLVVPTAEQHSDDEAGDGQHSDAVGVRHHPSAGSSSPVVVGVDESHRSRLAALHAAQAATERDTWLLVLMALPMPTSELSWYPELTPASTDLAERRRAHLQTALEEDIAWLREQVPGLKVSGEVRLGEPSAVLHDVTSSAQLTVVGTRGRGAIASALLGSTSRAILDGAEGPVMVVPLLADDRLEG